MGLFGSKPSMIISIPNMNCGHCEAKVSNALKALEGVGKFSVDLPGKKVNLTLKPGKELGFDAINEALSAAGYPAEQV